MAINRTLTLRTRLDGAKEIINDLQTIKKTFKEIQQLTDKGLKISLNDQVTKPFKDLAKAIRQQIPEVQSATKLMVDAAVAEVNKGMAGANVTASNNFSKAAASRVKASIPTNLQDILNQPINAGIQYNRQLNPMWSDYYIAQREQRVAQFNRPLGIDDQSFSDVSNYANSNVNTRIKNIGILSSVTPQFEGTSMNEITLDKIRATSLNKLKPEEMPSYEKVVKSASQAFSRIQDMEKVFLKSEGDLRRQLGVQIGDEYDNLVKRAKVAYSEEVAEAQKAAEAKAKLLQTGFGMYIMSMYLSPIKAAFNDLSNLMIEKFSEFDKLYTDYAVKSESFGNALARTDLYKAAVNQTYALNDEADAAERFAASGIDIAENQEALTKTMQVATIAHMDYKDAANGIIQTMQAMHMQVSQVTEITDSLTAAANESTAELQDMVSWFEYAASSAYNAGVNVQQLAAYLGILKSSGLPGTGAAIRQMFVQLEKEDVQEKLKSKFTFIEDEDFYNMDLLIGKLRDYVQTSDDQAKAEREITSLLGGRVNAQQALGNLLVAEPDLWNRMNSAVQQAGTTQSLYAKVTDNAADAMQRIKNNLDIIITQFGGFIGIVLKVADKVIGAITSIIVAIPDPVKAVLGLVIALTAAAISFGLAVIGVAGGLAIIKYNLDENAASGLLFDMTLKDMTATMYNLTAATARTTASVLGFNTAIDLSTAKASLSNLSMTGVAKSILSVGGAMKGVMGLAAGWMLSSYMTNNAMYDQARAVNTLAGAWMAYQMSAYGLPGIVAGVALGTGYALYANDQVNTAQNNAQLDAMSQRTGIKRQGDKQYNVSIQHAHISSDGLNLDDLLDAAGVDY